MLICLLRCAICSLSCVTATTWSELFGSCGSCTPAIRAAFAGVGPFVSPPSDCGGSFVTSTLCGLLLWPFNLIKNTKYDMYNWEYYWYNLKWFIKYISRMEHILKNCGVNTILRLPSTELPCDIIWIITFVLCASQLAVVPISYALFSLHLIALSLPTLFYTTVYTANIITCHLPKNQNITVTD